MSDTAYVIEAVIRVPDSDTAEWVVRQIAALLADRADGAHLDSFGIIESEAYDAEQPGDAELFERVLAAGN